MSVLRIDKLTLKRGHTWTARDISLKFDAGRVHAILGPNGTGKSSLIKAIFGEIGIESGEIRLDDEKLSPRRLYKWRRSIGYMPQDTGVEAVLSALEVVLLGRMDALHMHVGDDDLVAALGAMRAVGIDHLAQRDIQSLSGGQRQLALFAQVMLREPKILLLDEITVMILHDLSLAAQYADRITLLGGARIVADGPPAEVLEPGIIGELYQVKVERLIDSQGMPVIRPLANQFSHSSTFNSSGPAQ
jgi:iron complex transport system ATP-binding protein